MKDMVILLQIIFLNFFSATEKGKEDLDEDQDWED